MNEVKLVGKRFKGAIDIPEWINVHDGIKIYNQGWGHSLRQVIKYLRNHDVVDEEELIAFVNSKRDNTYVHQTHAS